MHLALHRRQCSLANGAEGHQSALRQLGDKLIDLPDLQACDLSEDRKRLRSEEVRHCGKERPLQTAETLPGAGQVLLDAPGQPFSRELVPVESDPGGRHGQAPGVLDEQGELQEQLGVAFARGPGFFHQLRRACAEPGHEADEPLDVLLVERRERARVRKPVVGQRAGAGRRAGARRRDDGHPGRRLLVGQRVFDAVGDPQQESQGMLVQLFQVVHQEEHLALGGKRDQPVHQTRHHVAHPLLREMRRLTYQPSHHGG